LKELKDRLDYESLMIFIMELLSLQLSAITSCYREIMSAMEKMKFSTATIEQVNIRFSRGIALWDINNFIYPAARKLFEKIALEFGIPKLKEEHRTNLSTFEKLAAMKSQKEIQRTSQTTQNYFMFFSVLSAIGTLGMIVGLVFDSSEGILSAIITLILGCITTALFITTLLLAKRNARQLQADVTPTKKRKRK
jgi:hypothetical protein